MNSSIDSRPGWLQGSAVRSTINRGIFVSGTINKEPSGLSGARNPTVSERGESAPAHSDVGADIDPSAPRNATSFPDFQDSDPLFASSRPGGVCLYLRVPALQPVAAAGK